MTDYTNLDICNPFCAPVFFTKVCESTMIESRRLLNEGAESGTVFVSDYQSGGVGRIKNRRWVSQSGFNLLFTIILRYDDFAQIPQLLTLKAGLAVYRGIAQTEPQLKDDLRIKWPNDIMLNNKKICGIVSVCDGANVFIGIGVNVAQSVFEDLPNVTSISNELVQKKIEHSFYKEYPHNRFVILQNILNNLYSEIHNNSGDSINEINEILFLKDKNVIFMAGSADKPKRTSGILRSINALGHIQIEQTQSAEILSFASGELQIQKNQK